MYRELPMLEMRISLILLCICMCIIEQHRRDGLYIYVSPFTIYGHTLQILYIIYLGLVCTYERVICGKVKVKGKVCKQIFVLCVH